MMDVETNLIIYTNKAFAHMHGYADDRLIGCHYSVLFTEEQLKEAEKFKVGALTEVDFGAKELWRMRKDGSVFPTITKSIAVRDNKGRPLFISVTAIDITERKQAEEEIRKFKTISDNAGYGTAIASIEGEFLYLNEAYAQMHGYTIDELIGKHYSILYTEEALQDLERFRQKLLQKGSFFAEELWRRRKDNTIFPSLTTAGVVKDNKGMPLFISATAIDITERKQAEERLQQSEENLKAYLESAPDGIYIIDLKGTFLYGNKKAEEIMGYKREELIGKSFLNLKILPGKHLAKAGKLLALNVMGKPTGPDEFEIIRKDGSHVWVEINTALLSSRRAR
jgi:PAS domain S-box-containing protein